MPDSKPIDVLPDIRPPYAPAKTAKAALKVGILTALGVLLADVSGLTAWLVSLLPDNLSSSGAIIITMLLTALRNWVINRPRTS